MAAQNSRSWTKDLADLLWVHSPLATPDALSSSRAHLFVSEYYDVKKVKMRKTPSQHWCASSFLGMCWETLIHQLLGSSPACQCPTEVQRAEPQATEMLKENAGEKLRKSLGNCHYTTSCLSMCCSHTNPAELVAGGTCCS